ncbi:MAG: hypothetical protein EXS01_05830 [Phycisphaerales bacterium]|nr:hypothetical protein [Phycisphaerales bacterium]
MERFAPIISLALLSLTLGCSSAPSTVLESDIPNVTAMEAIVTRDLVRENDQIIGVTVLYRGEVSDCQVVARATRSAYADHGWTLISQQARGTSTVLNFAKDRRAARIELSENQIDPMTSPAVLRVSLAKSESTASSAALLRTPPAQSSSAPEGFAPPSN